MEERAVTLQELLESRERRALRQQELLKTFGGVLISVTLNIPGAVKDKPAYRNAMRQGMFHLRAVLEAAAAQILQEEIRELPTGTEGYLCVHGISAAEVKEITIEIEDGSPLGRLFDMDVLTAQGAISRRALGKKRRKCFICGQDAKVCARGQRHPMEQLLQKINQILEQDEKPW